MKKIMDNKICHDFDKNTCKPDKYEFYNTSNYFINIYKSHNENNSRTHPAVPPVYQPTQLETARPQGIQTHSYLKYGGYFSKNLTI
jgi:hypothetical protein